MFVPAALRALQFGRRLGSVLLAERGALVVQPRRLAAAQQLEEQLGVVFGVGSRHLLLLGVAFALRVWCYLRERVSPYYLYSRYIVIRIKVLTENYT